jgi:hypothetical protein
VKVPLPRIQPLLAFRDLLEGPPEGFGAWRAPEGQFPWYELSPRALAFVAALDREGFVIAYDWDAWLQASPDYVAHSELLADADLETLRRLLTAHVRADRFTDGHLAEMHRTGHLAAILRHLEELHRAGVA